MSSYDHAFLYSLSCKQDYWVLHKWDYWSSNAIWRFTGKLRKQAIRRECSGKTLPIQKLLLTSIIIYLVFNFAGRGHLLPAVKGSKWFCAGRVDRCQFFYLLLPYLTTWFGSETIFGSPLPFTWRKDFNRCNWGPILRSLCLVCFGMFFSYAPHVSHGRFWLLEMYSSGIYGKKLKFVATLISCPIYFDM